MKEFISNYWGMLMTLVLSVFLYCTWAQLPGLVTAVLSFFAIIGPSCKN